MRRFERLFPRSVVRQALWEIDKLEKSLPNSLGQQLGFDVIKVKLRQHFVQNPDRLCRAIQDGQKIECIVLIVARNIVLDELTSGEHMLIGTRNTMTGDGLISLFDYLTSCFEKAGIETAEQARETKTGLREMIKERFGLGH